MRWLCETVLLNQVIERRDTLGLKVEQVLEDFGRIRAIPVPEVNRQVEEALFEMAYELELEYDCLIDLIVFGESVSRNQTPPIYEKIVSCIFHDSNFTKKKPIKQWTSPKHTSPKHTDMEI